MLRLRRTGLPSPSGRLGAIYDRAVWCIAVSGPGRWRVVRLSLPALHKERCPDGASGWTIAAGFVRRAVSSTTRLRVIRMGGSRRGRASATCRMTGFVPYAERVRRISFRTDVAVGSA